MPLRGAESTIAPAAPSQPKLQVITLSCPAAYPFSHRIHRGRRGPGRMPTIGARGLGWSCAGTIPHPRTTACRRRPHDDQRRHRPAGLAVQDLQRRLARPRPRIPPARAVAPAGWQDIKQRYRRSTLGPLWITIATGVMALAPVCCTQCSSRSRSPTSCRTSPSASSCGVHLRCIKDGAEIFIDNEGLIKQLLRTVGARLPPRVEAGPVPRPQPGHLGGAHDDLPRRSAGTCCWPSPRWRCSSSTACG